jgi:hypothetical protein
MAKKYSAAFNRDYEFYMNNLLRFDFAGREIPVITSHPEGSDAKRCFYVFDSRGKLPPCREPEILASLLRTKASVNLHIKLWAAGRFDGTFPGVEFDEYMREIGAPDWVKLAVRKQQYKLLMGP